MAVAGAECCADGVAGLVGWHLEDAEAESGRELDPSTVARNVREQEADARPAIADPLRSIAPYDVVLLASPLWNVRPPMIMRTFAGKYDFAGPS